ncbi:hypothetical protein TA3x_000860 [Tundrisphaera sp. TA3]|uniref:hypothetical protein n=1 Tax=Tundrisphaera sp. TA3 TaxID=3435775 RepID=UPI003EBC7A9D
MNARREKGGMGFASGTHIVARIGVYRWAKAKRPEKRVKAMAAIEQMPFLVGAIQYSILYMLFGGGIMGAIVIFIVAKMFGK